MISLVAGTALLSVSGCRGISVLENRFDCPGRLVLTHGEPVPGTGLSVLVVSASGAIEQSADGVFASGGPDTLSFDLDGGVHHVVSWTGGTCSGGCIVPDLSAPLFAGTDSAAVNPDRDVTVSVRTSRRSMRLAVNVLSGGLPYEGDAPVLTLSGPSGALAVPSLSPVPGGGGGFSSVMSGLSSGRFSSWVPVQAGGELSLSVAVPGGEPFACDVGALLKAQGYVWSGGDLADAEVSVDLSPVAIDVLCLPEVVSGIGAARVPLLSSARVRFALSADGSSPLPGDGTAAGGVALYADEEGGAVFFAALDSAAHTVYVLSDGVMPGSFSFRCAMPSPSFSSAVYAPDPYGEPLPVSVTYAGLPEAGALTDAATRSAVLAGLPRIDSPSALQALSFEVRTASPLLVYRKTLDLPGGQEGTLRLDVSDFEAVAKLFGTTVPGGVTAVAGGAVLDVADVYVGMPDLGPITFTEIRHPRRIGEIGYVKGDFSSLRNLQFATNPGYMRPFSGGVDEMADMSFFFDPELDAVFFVCRRQGSGEFRLRADFTSGAEYPPTGAGFPAVTAPDVWLDAASYVLPASGASVDVSVMRDGVYELGSLDDGEVRRRVLAGTLMTESSVYSKVLEPGAASTVEGIVVSGSFPLFRLKLDTSEDRGLYGKTFPGAFVMTFAGQELDKPVYFPSVSADVTVEAR